MVMQLFINDINILHIWFAREVRENNMQKYPRLQNFQDVPQQPLKYLVFTLFTIQNYIHVTCSIK